jgi:hypothetical protein
MIPTRQKRGLDMKKIAGLAAAALAGVTLSGCIVVDAMCGKSHWDHDDDFGYDSAPR